MSTKTKYTHPALNTTISDQAALYVGTYAKYNNGSISGAWVDLTEVSTLNEFYEICAGLHSDESDPEYMFQDYQGFPSSLYCESSAREIFTVLEYINENLTDKPLEAIFGFLEHGREISEFENCYIGPYDSERSFSDEYFDDIYLSQVPKSIQYYINYQSFCDDLFINDYTYIDGYVFRNQ